MHASATVRRLTHWIAILAVLLAALAPSLSQAIGAASGTAWVEVCTVQGAKWVAVGEADEDQPASAAHAFEHCAWCALHIDSAAPPPGSVPALSTGLSDPPARAFLQAPHTLHAWRSAQARAPPATC